MPNTNEAAKKAVDNKGNETSNNAQNKMTETKNTAADTASDASGSIQKAAETAQSFVSDKAQQINDYAQQAYGKAYETANKLGSRATDAFNTSAEYVKNIDVEKARESVKTAVKEKPELSIAIAALTGLVIGLIIGRSGGDKN